jgi:pimeloyl-ACP methyl ester carboxylesterase
MVTQTQLTEQTTSRFAVADGLRIHYNEAGSGPAVVMLHGGGPGASGWSNFQRNVGPMSQRFHTLLLDQPGYGKSEPARQPEPSSQVGARVIRDLLDVLGIEKASLVGNSMGGATAINFAIDYPDRTDKLVVMGAAAVTFGGSIFAPAPTEGIRTLGEVRANPTADGMRRLIQLMVYDSSFLTDELLEQRLSAALANHRPGEERGGGQRRLSEELGKVRAKTLIVWGRDDRVNPLDGGLRLLWGIPDAQMHVYSKCGHWARFEHADEFNRLVTDFLTND